MPRRTVAVDDRRYETQFDGFDRPLTARSACGQETELPPWTWRQHLAALRCCSHVVRGALALDAPAFAQRVLSTAERAAAPFAPFAPLALWWAAGGDDEPGRAGPGERRGEGWYDLGGARVRLRAWRERERLSALDAAFSGTQDGGTPGGGTPGGGTPGGGTPGDDSTFDPFTYLDAMLRASVAELAPARDLDDLDSGTLAHLLPAVVALNVAEAEETPASRSPLARQTARETLLLCRLLGWTPSQVWAAPAAEVSRLLQLAALAAEPAGPGPGATHGSERQRPGIAEHPDAVVIRFE